VKRVFHGRFADRALRGAALVVTDRRWAAPLSAAALGLGIFAGVAIGPGTAGTLATGAQVIELPGSGDEEGQSGGGGGAAVPTEPGPPLGAGGAAGGFEEEAFSAGASFVPAPVAPLPAPAPQPAPSSGKGGEAEEKAEGQSFEGTVVHINPAAGSYTIAIEGGELVAVHAAELPEPGAKLSVPVSRLANGTFAAGGEVEEEKGRAKSAELRGVVTYVSSEPEAPAYTVSGRGSSLLVHLDPDPSGAAPQLPAVGAYVTLTAAFRQPPEPDAAVELVEEKRKAEAGPPSTYLDLAGILGEVLSDGQQILFSADDAREGEADLTLSLAKGIDATKLEPGDSYLATATVEEDGTLTLSGVASDEHAKGADDAGSAQGDLKR
jgi:hypothetical protein